MELWGKTLSDPPENLPRSELVSLMREALRQAEEAGRAGEHPVGAVVVVDGKVIAAGRARHREKRSQLMHAELQALLEGGEPLWLNHGRAILITSVEPCLLCLGATVMADVPHIVFASHDPVVQTPQVIRSVPYVERHIRTYLGGVLEEESHAIIQRYDPEYFAYMVSGGQYRSL